MRKFLISAFITSSVILTAIFWPNVDSKIEVPPNLKNTPNDNLVVEDKLIDNFQFVNLEELKSSSSGLIRMSHTTDNDTKDIHKEESIDVTESDLQWDDSFEGEIIDQISTDLTATR